MSGTCASHSSMRRVQRGAKAQPPGRLPGDGAWPGMPTRLRPPVRRGIAPTSRRVYGCAERLEELVGGAELDDASGVHHRDPSGDGRHHGEVVGDVERRDIVRAASSRTVASTVDCVVTSRPVVGSSSTMRRGRLANAIARPDALLLTAGELVRVALAGTPGRPRARPRASSPRSARRSPCRSSSRAPRAPHAAGGRSGVPGSATRPGPAARRRPTSRAAAAARRRPSSRMSSSPSRIVPPVISQAAARMAEQRQPDGGLARAGLADHTEHLAGSDLEGRVRHDGDAVVGLDPEVPDRDRCPPPGARGRLVCQLVGAHSSPRSRSMPAAVRPMPSPISPVPMVSSAIARIGSRAPHGS